MEDTEVANLRRIWGWYQMPHSSKYSGVGMFATCPWCGSIPHDHPYSVELVRTCLSTLEWREYLGRVLKTPSGHGNPISYKWKQRAKETGQYGTPLRFSSSLVLCPINVEDVRMGMMSNHLAETRRPSLDYLFFFGS